MAFSDLKFAEGDANVIADKLKGLYEAVRRAGGEPGYRLAQADPERLVQLTEAAVLSQINTDIDLTGKGNLLYFANEETIEHIGFLYGKRGERLPASPAMTTIRYTLVSERSKRTVIPKGYRITPDNKIYFATVQAIEIPVGELYGDVEAECMTPGDAGMGFDIGEIKNMVDIVPFVISAVNITPTSGGGEKEDIESYRERLRLLPESFSVAGPDGAYEFWARSANPGIADTRVWMPELEIGKFAAFLTPWGISDAEGFLEALNSYFRDSGTGPGNVNIAVLMKEGELPSPEVIEQVQEKLDDKTVRPLTDYVHVIVPEEVSYNIKAKYWITTENATMASSIIQSVEAAVDRFVKWQRTNLGLDINPSYLHQLIMEAGVKWVEITEPLPTKLEPWEVGVLNIRQITYEGLEDR